MRGLGLGILLTAVSMVAGEAVAEEVLYWQSGGFAVGDAGGSQTSAEGLSVSWVAEPSYADGRMSVVAEFCDVTGSGWEGGMRLTHIPPDRGHLTLTVSPGNCVTREEIIPTGVDAIYVYLSRY